MVTAIAEYMFSFHTFVQVVIPSILAEMVNSKMDTIKLILHQRMLEEKGIFMPSFLNVFFSRIKTTRKNFFDLSVIYRCCLCNCSTIQYFVVANTHCQMCLKIKGIY